MLKTILLLAIALSLPALSLANDIPDPIYSWAEAENCGRFTIAPGGGEDLVDDANDYRIHVWCRDSNDDPVPMAATDISLYHPSLVLCPGIASQADDHADEQGHATISGTISAGLAADGQGGVDCAETLLFVLLFDIVINGGEPVCVAVDSPDLNGDLEVGIADFGRFAHSYQESHAYDPCHDYSEDGMNSIADLAIFANFYHQAHCE